MKRSITWRLAAMFALAALVTFSLIGAALYGVLRAELMRHQRDELGTYQKDMEYLIRLVTTADRWSRAQAKMDALTPADGSVRFWVLSDDPRFQYGKGLAEIEGMERDTDGLGTIVLPRPQPPLRTLTRTIDGAGERPTLRLIVGVGGAAYEHTLRTFAIAMTALSLAAVALVMLLGHWVARVGLRPLKQLSDEVQALSPRSGSQRLRVAPLADELSDLTLAFNGALARSDAAYRQLEAFNADVAHELRTPLANLIGETQVALSRPRSAPEFAEVLESNLEELERLRSIVNDMLFLARADQGEAATGLVVAPIVEEVRKTIEFFEVLLDERRMSVEIEGDRAALAPIETSLFRRALSNLLQNAIQHSSECAQIRIRIAQREASVRIAVSNRGEPIAEAYLPRLFDRFYRVDAARSDTSGHCGHGLGLAIVRAVAEMHGGEVFAACAGGLTTIGFSVARAKGT
jgi:two-component system heavy metal sensor histidine kinase CusS